jgi:serine phosphatase RsbU (regulator of sigma subunit)
MNIFYHPPKEQQIYEALDNHEMRVENLLNKIRSAIFFIILFSDVFLIIETRVERYNTIFYELLIMLLLLSFYYIINHLTSKHKYHYWIKYATVTADLGGTFAYSQYAFKHMLFTPDPSNLVVVMSIMIIFFNTLSVLRGGIRIIIFSGILALILNFLNFLILGSLSSAVVYTSVFILLFTLFNLYAGSALIENIVSNDMLNRTMENLKGAGDKIEVQNNLLVSQRDQISSQNREIKDSISYALRIQTAILPPDYYVKKCLSDSFVLYLPKAVVSGDFYFVDKVDEHIVFSAIDCTGHGVPGAMMSVIGYTLLHQAIKLKRMTKPSDILEFLDSGVTDTLRQMAGESGVNDGMDLALCSLNTLTKEVQYAGAYNSMVFIRKGELMEIKADKFPIGSNFEGINDIYTNHSVQLATGDIIYLYSDGYADQFGGPKDKKFKYNQLNELLLTVHTLPMNEQFEKLKSRYQEWKGENEQTDDVIVMGVKIV